MQQLIRQLRNNAIFFAKYPTHMEYPADIAIVSKWYGFRLYPLYDEIGAWGLLSYEEMESLRNPSLSILGD
jgi:hypothetical protein